MSKLNDETKAQLESMIDKHGLESVMRAIADICEEKAEHILSVWQDKNTAMEWQDVSAKIDTFKDNNLRGPLFTY